MKYIKRWSLMRSVREENIMEHSQQVAVIAHALALINNKIMGGNLDANLVVMLAQYHEVGEVITGDLPTPIKYYNPEIKTAYKQVERVAGERLLTMLPSQLRESYAPLVMESDEQIGMVVKAADKLSAYIKCVEEQKAGNTEFDSAAKQTMDSMQAMGLPELDWFLENCLAPFSLNLDQL
jgi:5'-deoxynucleotidase